MGFRPGKNPQNHHRNCLSNKRNRNLHNLHTATRTHTQAHKFNFNLQPLKGLYNYYISAIGPKKRFEFSLFTFLIPRYLVDMYEYSQLCHFTLEVNVPLPSNVRNNSSLVYTSFNKTQLCIEKWLYSRPHLTGEREHGTKTNDVFSYFHLIKEESFIHFFVHV